MENSKRVIVAFHTGRGGRFYNGGHVTFIGEKTFQDLIQMNSDNLFLQNRDQHGRFCKTFYTDLNGTVIVDAEDVNKETGSLEFDTIYDTDGCCYVDECSDEQLQLIAESTEFKSASLSEYLEKRGFLIES